MENFLESYPDSIVPRLSLRCQWLDSEPVTNCSVAQAVAALDFVCNDPHLHRKVKKKKKSGWKKCSTDTLEEKICNGPDLVQGAHGNLADIIRDVFPGGALGVTGGHTLPVPQVLWTGSSHIIVLST